MTDIASFGPHCTLGEGPLWHPERERLFWFDIPAGILYSTNPFGGQLQQWRFGEAASAAGWVDNDTLIVATETGLQKFDIPSGNWQTLAPLEDGNPITRSNDGRIGPDGAFWIGTMGHKLEPHVGSYYRYKNGQIHQLFDSVSVPNATCFAPDGSCAYLADTFKQVIWQWPLDGDGNPTGEREKHIDLRDKNLNPDGAICDAEGFLWNAQWGASRIARYAPDGSLDKIIELPVSQPTCPAFGGPDLKTLFITSAREGLSEEALAEQPDAGRTLRIEMDVPGIREFQASIITA
ncbi:MAG: SMP-30/gluconolactonase/LRE family protein [Pseudomonadota bacterium]